MLTQPLKWHGGKHYLAKKIIAMMPPHTHYVEPYFGGGAVLLEKDPEGVSEVVNDIDGELMNFWECLQDRWLFDELSRMLNVTPFSEIQFAGAVNMAKTPLNQAINFFIRCRQSRAGNMKEFATLTRRRTRRGMNEQVSAWLTAIEGLPAVHARLKRVVILNQDALKVIKSQDGPSTLFYLDPTYLHETRAKGAVGDYKYEMSTTDHLEMLDLISCECDGLFMLSGYPSEMYDKILHAWERIEFKLPNNIAGGKSKRTMTEVVWSNF
ncbi:hypothetical protein LCGC14_0357170 [marine sediment metagenome]|uniref:Uncharacterized protein n=1 Tax=marine sediment metagenome TaxID=412755 RepID=A0A0F9WH62_9ZZZZ